MVAETIYNANGIPLPPIEKMARFDEGAWWYECPACGKSLDYKQKLCSCCSLRIDWACTVRSDDDNPNDTSRPNWIVT